MGSVPKITEIKAFGGFQEPGGGWSLLNLSMTVDITGKSKCTIASSSGVTVAVDGVGVAFTPGVAFDILNKSTMIIYQNRAQMGYVLWTNVATGIYIE